MRPFSSSKITHFLRPVCYVRCRGDQWSPAVKRTHPAHNRHTRIHHHDASSALQKCGNEAPTKPRVGRRLPQADGSDGDRRRITSARPISHSCRRFPFARAKPRAPRRGARSLRKPTEVTCPHAASYQKAIACPSENKQPPRYRRSISRGLPP